MGVRTNRKAKGQRSKRERVVDAATRLFLRQGFGTTGMDAIAEEAGVSKATLYSYYRDKASLFAGVMHQICDELGGDDVRGLVGDTPEATLKAVAVFGMQRLTETLERGILQRVLAESRDFPELGDKFWTTGPGKLEAFVAEYLGEAKRRGVLDVKDPPRTAARFIGLTMGMYLLPMLLGSRGRPSAREMREDLEEVVAGFLSTLRPKPRRSGRRSLPAADGHA